MTGMFDSVDDEDQRKRLYTLFALLSNIVNIIATRAIHREAIYYVDGLLLEYNNLFKLTFDDSCTINQHMSMHIRGEVLQVLLFCLGV